MLRLFCRGVSTTPGPIAFTRIPSFAYSIARPRVIGNVYAREPGIVVRRAVTPEDGVNSLFAITFWKQQFKTYASVTA